MVDGLGSVFFLFLFPIFFFIFFFFYYFLIYSLLTLPSLPKKKKKKKKKNNRVEAVRKNQILKKYLIFHFFQPSLYHPLPLLINQSKINATIFYISNSIRKSLNFNTKLSMSGHIISLTLFNFPEMSKFLIQFRRSHLAFHMSC
jgi:hypothetical protein